MSDLISIIIPVYNLGKLVDGIVECLFEQTYQNYEAIFVDDGSSDDSLNYLINIAEKNPQCRFISQNNQGAAEARNHGINEAVGKYICFIDGDDKIAIDYLEKMLFLIKNDNSDLVVCNYYAVDYNNCKLVEKHAFDLKKGTYFFPDDKILINNIGNAPWNKLYRLELIKNNNICFPKNYRHHDLVFVQRYLLCCKKISFTEEYLNYYLKDRPNNISTSYDNKINHILVMLDLVVEEYLNRNLFEICYEQIQQLCLENLILSLRKLNKIDNMQFADNFINESFMFINKYFKNYRDSKFYRGLNRSDKIYLNKLFLKLYLRYKKRI